MRIKTFMIAAAFLFAGCGIVSAVNKAVDTATEKVTNQVVTKVATKGVTGKLKNGIAKAVAGKAGAPKLDVQPAASPASTTTIDEKGNDDPHGSFSVHGTVVTATTDTGTAVTADVTADFDVHSIEGEPQFSAKGSATIKGSLTTSDQSLRDANGAFKYQGHYTLNDKPHTFAYDIKLVNGACSYTGKLDDQDDNGDCNL